MQSTLPITGTVELLERLSDFIPDEFINNKLAFRRCSGQRRSFAPAQLWRTHLLALLTSAHSFNAVVRLLPEQRGWRRFARLPQRQQTGWVLNCQPHDIPSLIAARLLKPLGNPPPNGVKYFATAEIMELAKDRPWLVKMTTAINQHWQRQNARKKIYLSEGAQNGHSLAPDLAEVGSKR